MIEDTDNPANESGIPAIPAGYRPMSAAQLKLEVPQRPGYHRHWFRGTAGRIAQAQQAGYKYVEDDQAQVNNFDLGGDAKTSGNTDLGTRVSIVSGEDVDGSGQPSRMYLMECPIHLREYADKLLAQRNESVAEALRGGKIGTEQDEQETDTNARYVKGKTPDLFNPNKSQRR